MKKFQNKYRIPSARLQNWDYGANGAYFITICTDKMQHYFGTISESELQLNELGKLAYQLWEEIANQFPYTELGNFIIMPNHVHGILIINKSANVIASKSVQTQFIASHIDNKIAENLLIAGENVETRFIASVIEMRSISNENVETQLIADENVETRLIADENVETRLIASVRKGGVAGDKNPMLNENISRIIRWYKGRCSFEMRKIHADFSWHSRFHDHIIRDSKSFENIQTYIENNPSKWEEDKFYK